MGADCQAPEPYVVAVDHLDPTEVMLNVGQGVQTLVVDGQGLIVAAVLPVQSWYPGAVLPADATVMRPGQWLNDAIDVRGRRRAAQDAAEGAERL